MNTYPDIPKTIYFVRHSESDANVLDMHVPPHKAHLTAKGKTQSEKAALFFKDITIQSIHASTYIRAIETAEMINKYHNHVLHTHDILKERVKPSEVYSMKRSDPHAQQIITQMNEHFGVQSYKYSDEENFTDLYTRAHKVLEYIHTLPEGKHICVTHGYFLRFFLTFMITKQSDDPQQYIHFMKLFRCYNASINTLECDKEQFWRIQSWNSISHLR